MSGSVLASIFIVLMLSLNFCIASEDESVEFTEESDAIEGIASSENLATGSI